MSDINDQLRSPIKRSQEMISPLLRVALLLGIAIHLAGFLIFRVISSPLPHREATRPYVGYLSPGSLASDLELEEQAALFDSAPLFIPTRWNASQAVLVNFGDASRGQFPEFEPDIKLLGELQPAYQLLANDFQVNQPLDLLASRYWRFFNGFGESVLPVVPFPDTPPMAEVRVLGESWLPPILIPAELNYTTAVTVAQPVLYYVRKSANGLVLGTPTLGKSSGNEAFDSAVVQWLSRPEVLGQLPSGYLSIDVFPW